MYSNTHLVAITNPELQQKYHQLCSNPALQLTLSQTDYTILNSMAQNVDPMATLQPQLLHTTIQLDAVIELTDQLNLLDRTFAKIFAGRDISHAFTYYPHPKALIADVTAHYDEINAIFNTLPGGKSVTLTEQINYMLKLVKLRTFLFFIEDNQVILNLNKNAALITRLPLSAETTPL